MSWLRKLADTFRPGRLGTEIDHEIEFHLEMRARELTAKGMTADEARERVRQRFGNVTGNQEKTRDADVLGWLDGLVRDGRNSLRSLMRSPAYALMAVLILSLGLGGTIAIFSVLYSTVLRPFAFPDSRQLTILLTREEKGQADWVSYQDLQDWSRTNKSFSGLAGWVSQTANLTGEGDPDRLRAGYATSNFFPLMGVGVFKGRAFAASSDERQPERIAVLSYGLWMSRYGGSESALGRKIILNNEPFEIAGVLPETFENPWDHVDVWLPLGAAPTFKDSRSATCCVTFGRMKPGVRLEQAQAEMKTIAQGLAQQYPQTNAGRRAEVSGMQEYLVRNLRSSLLLLMGAVVLVFLVACANLANLALARAISREREVAVRAALGASRGQLLRHLASETLLLCGAGCLLGLGLGYAGMRFLVTARGNDLPAGVQITFEPAIIAFGFGMAAFAGLLVAAAPAFRILRGKVSGLRDAERGSSHGPARANLRRLLMAGEMALSLVLLAGAALLVKSFERISSVAPGFQADHLLTMEYRMPQNRYPKPEQQAQFHRQVAERVGALPGVESATVVMALPFSGNGSGGAFIPLDRPALEKGKEPRTEINRADSRYFATLKIPVTSGRVFDDHDSLGAPLVAVINESGARAWWPDRSPLGRQIALPGFASGPLTIVGVVGDSRHSALETPQANQVYVAFPQHPHIFGTLAVRTAGDPLAMTAAVRNAVWSVDKDQPVWKIRTLESLLDNSVSYRRFLAALMGGFSLFTLLLAAIGMYGVSSYWVEQRTREIGVRVAMGARPGDVLRLVLGQGLRMTLAGLLAGTVAALGLARWIKAYLFGVEAQDPATLLTVAVVLSGVALVATLIPARRAAGRDPLSALRADA